MKNDPQVTVYFEGEAEDRAVLLLDAAENDGLDPHVVATVSGGFRVPKSLAKSAGVAFTEDDEVDLAVRQAETPGEDDTPKTTRMGAGASGRTDTNAGEDAVSGTVQNGQGETPLGDPRTEGSSEARRPAKKAAKKSTPRKQSKRRRSAKKAAKKTTSNPTSTQSQE